MVHLIVFTMSTTYYLVGIVYLVVGLILYMQRASYKILVSPMYVDFGLCHFVYVECLFHMALWLALCTLIMGCIFSQCGFATFCEGRVRIY